MKNNQISMIVKQLFQKHNWHYYEEDEEEIDEKEQPEAAEEIKQEISQESESSDNEDQKATEQKKVKFEAWYKVLGYKQDPCTILPTGDLIGMDDLKEEIKTWTIPSKNVCLLYGDTGSGKTSLLFILKEVFKEEDIKPIYLDCKTFSGREGLNFREEVYPEYEKYEELKGKGFVKAIKRIFNKEPKVILLLDEFQKLPSYLVDQIEGNFNMDVFQSVVCSQQKEEVVNCSGSFLQRLGEKKFQTTKLDANQCRELIEKRFKREILKENILNSIIFESKKVPRVILENLQRILIYLNKKGTLKSKITDGLVQLTEGEIIELRKEGIIRFEVPKDNDKEKTVVVKRGKSSLKSLKSRILYSLARSPKTQKELQEELGSTIGGIRKEISNLVRDDKVLIVKQNKPKKYSTNPEIKIEQVND